MSIKGVLLHPVVEECPYFDGLVTINESMIVKNLEDNDLENLLSRGFRHFGDFFFRPICTHCRSCIPMRIPVRNFSLSKSVRRLFNRNKHFDVTLEKPVPSKKKFQLYLRHKNRFEDKSGVSESYQLFVKSFFHPFPFNRVLTIREGTKTIAVSHLDVTANAMSAIYCYFDEDYARYSPGRFSVYKEIEIAKELGIQWLYLGYYIRLNRHMRYKVRFKPNQVMKEDDHWIDYLDGAGNVVNPLPQPVFRLLADYRF